MARPPLDHISHGVPPPLSSTARWAWQGPAPYDFSVRAEACFLGVDTALACYLATAGSGAGLATLLGAGLASAEGLAEAGTKLSRQDDPGLRLRSRGAQAGGLSIQPPDSFIYV